MRSVKIDIHSVAKYDQIQIAKQWMILYSLHSSSSNKFLICFVAGQDKVWPWLHSVQLPLLRGGDSVPQECPWGVKVKWGPSPQREWTSGTEREHLGSRTKVSLAIKVLIFWIVFKEKNIFYHLKNTIIWLIFIIWRIPLFDLFLYIFSVYAFFCAAWHDDFNLNHLHFDEMLGSLLHVLTMLFHSQACKWETWQQD